MWQSLTSRKMHTQKLTLMQTTEQRMQSQTRGGGRLSGGFAENRELGVVVFAGVDVTGWD